MIHTEAAINTAGKTFAGLKEGGGGYGGSGGRKQAILNN